MSQGDVLFVLEKEKKGLTSKEIYEKIKSNGVNISLGCVVNNISKLKKKGNGSNQVIQYYTEPNMQRPRYLLLRNASKAIKEILTEYPSWVNDL